MKYESKTKKMDSESFKQQYFTRTFHKKVEPVLCVASTNTNPPSPPPIPTLSGQGPVSDHWFKSMPSVAAASAAKAASRAS